MVSPPWIWAALWSVALGTWVLTPQLLRTHHLTPETPLDWVLVQAYLAPVFALLGLFLIIYPWLLVMISFALMRRRPRMPELLPAFVVPVLLIPTYAVASLALESWFLRGLQGFARHRQDVAQVALTFSVFAIVSGVGYTALARFRQRPRPATVAFALVMLTICGGFSTPWRTRPEVSAARGGESSIQWVDGRDARSTRPLLLIGVDSATWEVFRPLMEAGRLPNLSALVRQGISGDVIAEWRPYWSAPAWGAIVTGFGREEVGVYQDIAGHLPALPPFEFPMEAHFLFNPIYAVEYGLARLGLLRATTPPRESLKRAPVWEVLANAGRSTAVLRFGFTHPADRLQGVAVSDWAGQDQWQLLAISRGQARERYSREAIQLGLADIFEHAAPSPEPLREVFPPGMWRVPSDATLDPLAQLRIAVEIDERTVRAAEAVLGSGKRFDFIALYLGGFDTVSHAFWQYRFPGEYRSNPPDPDDVKVLGPVLDSYAEFIDRRIGSMTGLFTEPVQVLLVSDHGHGPTDVSEMWRGWHAERGMFVLAGPDIAPRAERIVVRYADIVPTILALQGFEKWAGINGTSVVPPSKP